MQTFDYARCWREVIEPEYKNLSDDIKALAVAVSVRSDDIKQNKESLDCNFVSDLWECMLAFDPNELAKAARIIYYYGHFKPGNAVSSIDNKAGATWKFSNLADQILCEACGIKRNRSTSDRGVSFAVYEGMIRRQFATANSWTWDEICYATPRNYGYILKNSSSELRGEADYNKFQEENKMLVNLHKDTHLYDSTAYMYEPISWKDAEKLFPRNRFNVQEYFGFKVDYPTPNGCQSIGQGRVVAWVHNMETNTLTFIREDLSIEDVKKFVGE